MRAQVCPKCDGWREVQDDRLGPNAAMMAKVKCHVCRGKGYIGHPGGGRSAHPEGGRVGTPVPRVDLDGRRVVVLPGKARETTGGSVAALPGERIVVDGWEGDVLKTDHPGPTINPWEMMP